MHDLIVYFFLILFSVAGGFALGRLKGVAITKVFQDHINALEAIAGNAAQVEGTKIRLFIDELRKKL
jgi:hypothetical protein